MGVTIGSLGIIRTIGVFLVLLGGIAAAQARYNRKP